MARSKGVYAKKLSVSVPGDLWEAAQAANPGAGPSELVQEALAALVAEGGET